MLGTTTKVRASDVSYSSRKKTCYSAVEIIIPLLLMPSWSYVVFMSESVSTCWFSPVGGIVSSVYLSGHLRSDRSVLAELTILHVILIYALSGIS